MINFYFVIAGMFVVYVIVRTQHDTYQKLLLLIIFAAILLWLEKPDWFIKFLNELRLRFSLLL